MNDGLKQAASIMAEPPMELDDQLTRRFYAVEGALDCLLELRLLAQRDRVPAELSEPVGRVRLLFGASKGTS